MKKIDPTLLAPEDLHPIASVAQLVEQRTLNPFVVGSIPSRGTTCCSNITGTFSVKQSYRAKLLTVAYTGLTQTEKGKPDDETETNPLPSTLW